MFISKDTRDNMRSAILNYIGDGEKFIPGMEYPEYLVSNYGNVYSTYTNKLLKPTKNDKGYLYVGLYKDGKKITTLVHVMVARTFLNNLYYEVKHVSANKTDNRLIICE